jgi:hypothetical protein
MSNFKPQVSYTTSDSLLDYRNGRRRTATKVMRFDTYRELKKELVEILKVSIDDYVFVSRSKRGEFGEWFEHWQLNSERKPVIIKEGWE